MRTEEGTAPVTYNRTIEAPFLAKNILKEEGTFANMHAIYPSIAVHPNEQKWLIVKIETYEVMNAQGFANF